MFSKKEDNRELVEEIFTGYGKKTLVSGWNFASESFPRDTPEDEQDQAISTYKRLGVFDAPTPPSTMRENQEIALSMPRPSRSYRPMVNLISYPYLFGENRKAMIEKIGLKSIPPGYGCTDYSTTNQVSYTNFVEGPMSPPPPMSEIFKPVTKYRRLLTDPFNIKRPNLGTFLDDNMEYLSTMRKSVSGPPPYGLDYQPVWTWEIK
ncbi:hypothetical protein GE061_009785 [Apolygus lucorum]|uniref:Uncharacterized protein n=1 Tax=Apolygus lucorum TaxID=248454 RepID=A0A6A4KC80_APOLU|nr:hypothetical protein GE061_009785 [Apolygus lucorum]